MNSEMDKRRLELVQALRRPVTGVEVNNLLKKEGLPFTASDSLQRLAEAGKLIKLPPAPVNPGAPEEPCAYESPRIRYVTRKN